MVGRSIGTAHAVAVAILFGLTLRFDYWSNTIELLGACLVAGHCLSWPLGLCAGIVLGLGRETLPFLALAGGWPIALGAAASTYTIRFFTHRDPRWDKAEQELAYGKPQWRRNLSVLGGADPPAYVDIAIYVLIAGLALFSAPVITVCLVATTVILARIDEPRVLTMLVPWAAMTLVRLWQ